MAGVKGCFYSPCTVLLMMVLMMLTMMSFLPLSADAIGSITTTTPVITQCWECQNYDSKGKYYDQCPLNGSVDHTRAYLGKNCTGKCFTRTDDLDDRLVFRGCTSSQWGLPNPLPSDGCYPWYSQIWCVCSTDGCNEVKLGNHSSNREFDAHTDYTNKKGDPVNCAHCLAIHTSSLLSLVVLILGDIFGRL